jgi:hypothetical protein
MSKQNAEYTSAYPQYFCYNLVFIAVAQGHTLEEKTLIYFTIQPVATTVVRPPCSKVEDTRLGVYLLL